MATQLNYYSNTDTSIEDMQNTLDGNFIGHHRVSLTEWGTTTVPQIAAGSIVENNGTLFKFTTNTTISGSPSDGTVYIYLVPSGDPTLGTANVTPTFTNTFGTWSDSKQGYYGTGGGANYRYLHFELIKAGSSYTKKEFPSRMLENAIFSACTINNLTLGNLVSSLPPIKQYNSGLHATSPGTLGAVYDFLQPYAPNLNNTIKVNGSIVFAGYTLFVSYAVNEGSSIKINGFFDDGSGIGHVNASTGLSTSCEYSLAV